MSDFTLSPPPQLPQATNAYVVLERGPAPDKRYDITAVTNTVGRSPQNEIVINDPEISRRHAQIVQRGDHFTVEDLGSTNGTFVNGQRCHGPTPLRHGDRIEFGDTVSLLFYQTVAAATAVAPVAPFHPDDEDTADLLPVKPPPRAVAPPQAAPQDQYLPADEPRPRNTRLLLGCVLAVVFLMCCCGILLVVLDSYQRGQYLYCGGLRPFWELLLGPMGFNPLCP